MDIIWNIRKFICCGKGEEDMGQDAKVVLMSDEIENKKRILADMRVLKNSIEHFGEYTRAGTVMGLSSAEIASMPQDDVDRNCELELCTSFLENCLPPKRDNKPTLVLDLDNTLVYSTTKQPKDYDHKLTISHNNKSQTVWVVERPYLQQFLDTLCDKYELVLFTAGIRQYGIKVLRAIDPKLRIQYLLDRRFCTILGKNQKNQDLYIKDLKILGRDLSKTIIVDDRDYSFCLDAANGHLIPSFDGDRRDNCLVQLQEYLLKCLDAKDIRDRAKLAYK